MNGVAAQTTRGRVRIKVGAVMVGRLCISTCRRQWMFTRGKDNTQLGSQQVGSRAVVTSDTVS